MSPHRGTLQSRNLDRVNAAQTRSDVNGTVKDRLIRAADAEIAAHGIDAVQMDAVAKAAGVSRATAFRQLGSVSEMLVQVALLRSERHVLAAKQVMATKTSVFAKLEAALVYTSRELPTDPCISALIAKHSESIRDPRVHRAALEAIGSVVKEGQRSGQVRTDLDTDELIDYMVEQSYFAAEDPRRSEDEVRRRFRHFIVPVLTAPSSMSAERAAWTLEIQDTVHSVIRQLKDLTDQLPGGPARVGSTDTG
jgi:AcrR family transcriptional regulator